MTRSQRCEEDFLIGKFDLLSHVVTEDTVQHQKINLADCHNHFVYSWLLVMLQPYDCA